MEINLPRGVVIARRLFQPTACSDFRGSNLTTIATSVRIKIASCLAMTTFSWILSMVACRRTCLNVLKDI